MGINGRTYKADGHKILLIAGVIIILLLFAAFRVVSSKGKIPAQASNITTVQVRQAQMTDSTATLSFKTNGSELRQPMAIAIIGGLVSSTLLTLRSYI